MMRLLGSGGEGGGLKNILKNELKRYIIDSKRWKEMRNTGRRKGRLINPWRIVGVPAGCGR